MAFAAKSASPLSPVLGLYVILLLAMHMMDAMNVVMSVKAMNLMGMECKTLRVMTMLTMDMTEMTMFVVVRCLTGVAGMMHDDRRACRSRWPGERRFPTDWKRSVNASRGGRRSRLAYTRLAPGGATRRRALLIDARTFTCHSLGQSCRRLTRASSAVASSLMSVRRCRSVPAAVYQGVRVRPRTNPCLNRRRARPWMLGGTIVVTVALRRIIAMGSPAWRRRRCGKTSGACS